MSNLTNSLEPEPFFGPSEQEPEQKQLEKKIPGAGAGAAWEKNQEPEPEPLEKKIRSQNRYKISRLPSPAAITIISGFKTLDYISLPVYFNIYYERHLILFMIEYDDICRIDIHFKRGYKL